VFEKTTLGISFISRAYSLFDVGQKAATSSSELIAPLSARPCVDEKVNASLKVFVSTRRRFFFTVEAHERVRVDLPSFHLVGVSPAAAAITRSKWKREWCAWAASSVARCGIASRVGGNPVHETGEVASTGRSLTATTLSQRSAEREARAYGAEATVLVVCHIGRHHRPSIPLRRSHRSNSSSAAS